MGEGNSRLVFRFAVLAVAAGFLLGLAVKPDKHRKLCLHGESSTMVEVRHGKTVVIQPATLSGCKP